MCVVHLLLYYHDVFVCNHQMHTIAIIIMGTVYFFRQSVTFKYIHEHEYISVSYIMAPHLASLKNRKRTLNVMLNSPDRARLYEDRMLKKIIICYIIMFAYIGYRLPQIFRLFIRPFSRR